MEDMSSFQKVVFLNYTSGSIMYRFQDTAIYCDILHSWYLTPEFSYSN